LAFMRVPGGLMGWREEATVRLQAEAASATGG